MTEEKQNELAPTEQHKEKETTRRAFLHRAGMAGAVGAASLGSLLTLASPSAKGLTTLRHDHDDDDREEGKRPDRDILVAAEIAEALAVTTYTNIIDTAPFFTRLPNDDQGYLVAARQEEMSHSSNNPSPTSLPRSNRSSTRRACSGTHKRR